MIWLDLAGVVGVALHTRCPLFNAQPVDDAYFFRREVHGQFEKMCGITCGITEVLNFDLDHTADKSTKVLV